jgi:hypothetical protein
MLEGEWYVSVRMIILLGIFVWAPMMGFLLWKYAQTFSFIQKSRATKRRARRALQLAGDGHNIYNQERRRLRRSF